MLHLDLTQSMKGRNNTTKPIPIPDTTPTHGSHQTVWTVTINRWLIIPMLLMVDTKQARWVYRVARNFCGSLFLRIGDFSVLPKLIFGIRTHWLFSMRINFCDFQKIPSTFPANRGLSRGGKNERKNERPASREPVPSIENIFVLAKYVQSGCNRNTVHIFKQYYG